MGIGHSEQDICPPSKWGFYAVQGVTPGRLIVHVVVCGIKIELSVSMLKNKPCVVYTIMRLIPWKRSHGSKTLIYCTNRKQHKMIEMSLDSIRT
jgi:hypothetical protein